MITKEKILPWMPSLRYLFLNSESTRRSKFFCLFFSLYIEKKIFNNDDSIIFFQKSVTRRELFLWRMKKKIIS